ncbi:MAG: PP2C family protein-serine/threonine phosphatase [Kosmotogaceae bacterium]
MNKILIIDDDPSVRVLLKKILQRSSFEVLEHDSGSGVKEIVEREEPDLVLLDLILPYVNGLQVLKELKNSSDTRELPVVVLTGSSDNKNRIKALQYGAVDYVTKPFLPEEVLLRVNTQLKMHNLINSLQEAVTNLRMDIEAASGIQKALVPSEIPNYENPDISWLYEPSYKVGGDIFDFIELGDEKKFVYIVDVAGHGVKASMLSVMVHRFIEDYINSHLIFDLTEFMKELELNFKFERFELFITIIALFIDYSEEKLHLANAGIPLPIFQRDGHTEYITFPQESLVGINLIKGEVNSMDFSKGDKIFLYSDGLTELRGKDDRSFGYKPLEKFLENHRSCKVDYIVKDLKEYLQNYRMYEYYEDDITFVAINF